MGLLIYFERSLLYAWVLSFINSSLGDLCAICVVFLICVEISLLYAWVLSFIIASLGEMCAIFVGFLIDFERSLLYALVLSCIIASLVDLHAICVGSLSMLRYPCHMHGLTQQIISTADLNRSSQQLIQTDNLEDNLNS